MVANAVVAGTVAAASVLRICRGRVWVTQAGLADDFWIDGGDTLILQPGGLIVIEAALASRIAVGPLTAECPPRGQPRRRGKLAQQLRFLGSMVPRLRPGRC